MRALKVLALKAIVVKTRYSGSLHVEVNLPCQKVQGGNVSVTAVSLGQEKRSELLPSSDHPSDTGPRFAFLVRMKEGHML